MKNFILICLFFLGLNAFAQTPKLKIILYPNNQYEYQEAIALMSDTLFNDDVCFDIVCKVKDETYPENHGVIKVDFISCEDECLLAVCHGQNLPSRKLLLYFANASMKMVNDPKIKNLN